MKDQKENWGSPILTQKRLCPIKYSVEFMVEISFLCLPIEEVILWSGKNKDVKANGRREIKMKNG